MGILRLGGRRIVRRMLGGLLVVAVGGILVLVVVLVVLVVVVVGCGRRIWGCRADREVPWVLEGIIPVDWARVPGRGWRRG
jgi:hypothetical protein